MQGLRSNFVVGEVATSDIFPALGVGDPLECGGYVATLPFSGPPEKA